MVQKTSKKQAAPKIGAKRYSARPPKRTASSVTEAVAAIDISAVAVAEPVSVEPIAKPTISIKSLVEDLARIDADIAREAAASLGLLGDRSAVEPLINVVANANGYFHSVVRAAAIASLGQIGDPRALATLVAAVRDPMAEASAEAVRALAALGDAQAIGVLIDVVRNADGFYVAIVRRAAVLALAQLGGASAVATLRGVAANEWEDATIRQTAQAALPASVA
jgi:HEAT repeat protein